MNYLKLIGILIISNATAAMDPPSHNTDQQQKIAQNIERVKVKLEANGFVTFSNLDESILTHEELNSLKKLLSMSTFQPPSQDEAHVTGSMHEFEVQFKRNDMEPADIIIGQRTINNLLSNHIIKRVAQQIVNILPTKSSGTMDLILYSDLERVISSACEDVLACKSPKTVEIELAPLVFHQDQ